jgi:hypothetical protein
LLAARLGETPVIDGYADPEDVLARIRTDRADAGRYRRSLRLRRARAAFTGQTDVRRRLTVQLHIVNDSLGHLRLAEAEIRDRLP